MHSSVLNQNDRRFLSLFFSVKNLIKRSLEYSKVGRKAIFCVESVYLLAQFYSAVLIKFTINEAAFFATN